VSIQRINEVHAESYLVAVAFAKILHDGKVLRLEPTGADVNHYIGIGLPEKIAVSSVGENKD